jgi:hypothetical protein
LSSSWFLLIEVSVLMREAAERKRATDAVFPYKEYRVAAVGVRIPPEPSDHRSDGGGLPEQLPQALQTLVAERTELPRMQRLHGCLQPIEQLASFLRDPRRDDPTVG